MRALSLMLMLISSTVALDVTTTEYWARDSRPVAVTRSGRDVFIDYVAEILLHSLGVSFLVSTRYVGLSKRTTSNIPLTVASTSSDGGFGLLCPPPPDPDPPQQGGGEELIPDWSISCANICGVTIKRDSVKIKVVNIFM